jgi:hypothetical protein
MRAALPLLSTVVGLASAHFKLDYPSWRGDSLAENTTYDQWSYPCTFVLTSISVSSHVLYRMSTYIVLAIHSLDCLEQQVLARPTAPAT